MSAACSMNWPAGGAIYGVEMGSVGGGAGERSDGRSRDYAVLTAKQSR